MRKTFGIHVCCLAMIGACSGDDSPGIVPDAGMPASSDAAVPEPDAGEVLPDASAPDAAPPASDGSPTGPTIGSVQTSDGYTQVRQGRISPFDTSVDLVIEGSRLEGITSVLVGELTATRVNAMPDEVRMRLAVPHGTVPGPRDVTVSGSDGSATLAGAIEVTPYVASPSALPDGQGTFQSPMQLCDDRVGDSRAGDTILLLAGVHECDDFVNLDGGQVIQGQETAKTVVRGRNFEFRGFEILSADVGSVTAFRDLAIETGARHDAIAHADDGTLVVERVAMTRAGIRVTCISRCPEQVTVRASTFDSLIGIETQGNVSTEMDVSDSSFRNYTVGIRFRSGRLRVNRTTFEFGSVAIDLEDAQPEAATAEIADSLFDRNQIGVKLEAGELDIRNTRILDRPSSTLPDHRGIYVTSGQVTASGVTISGPSLAGIEAFISAAEKARGSVNLTDVVIEGGQYGVRLHGTSQVGNLVMRSTTVRDQTVAAVSNALPGRSATDLDGDNQLSVVSGVALEDARVGPPVGAPIRAVGIALNGRSFTGTVDGPAEVLPYYRVVDDLGAIRFEDPVPP